MIMEFVFNSYFSQFFYDPYHISIFIFYTFRNVSHSNDFVTFLDNLRAVVEIIIEIGNTYPLVVLIDGEF